MYKAATIALLGLALSTMACQQQANPPPQVPPAGQPGAQPPPGTGPMAQHPGPGGPWAQQGRGDAPWGGGQRMHRPDGPGTKNKMMARGQKNKSGRMGRMPGAGPMGPGHFGGMGPMGPGPGGDMMMGAGALGVRFYHPAMLLRRSQEVGLTPDQVSKIRQEMLGSHSKAVDAHAKVQKARIEVTRLLAADKVDEKAINTQLDEVSKAQAELQKLHIGTMLRVRGLLTAEQRQKLDERKPKPRQGGPGAPGAGPVSGLEGDDADDEECGLDDDFDDFDDDEGEG